MNKLLYFPKDVHWFRVNTRRVSVSYTAQDHILQLTRQNKDMKITPTQTTFKTQAGAIQTQ